MGTFSVVILDGLGKHRPEVLLVDNDQVITAVVPEGRNDPLRDCIGTGCPDRSEQDLDTQAPGRLDEVTARDAVAVAQQVVWLPAPRKRPERDDEA